MAVDGEPAHAEFKQHGYLFLADEKNWPLIKKNYNIQKNLGVSVSLISPDEIKKLIPHINTDDISGAPLAPGMVISTPKAHYRGT